VNPGQSRSMLCLPLLLGAVVAGGACHDATEGGARPWASLAVQPVLPATVIPGQFDLAVDRARIRLTRAPAETVLDTLVFFPVGASQLTVRLRVPLVARRERLAASLELASGARLLFAGTDTVEVSESESLAPPIRLQYVGPGADISRLLIVPRDTALKPGDTFTFGVTAEASGVPVTQFYVNWSSSDPQLAAVNAVGTLTAPAQRGTIHLRVVSPTGIKDSTQIFFSPPPSSMARFGGDRQTWFAGLQLPQPLAVRVLAADSEGAPGVRVSFRSLSGGRVTDAVATTGMDGVARTVAILGPSAGIQGFEASAPGLAPLTFTATAQVGPPARIETLAGNTAAAKAAEDQVVANARQIAGAIEPYYGKAASEKLFGLLAGHYGAVKEYLVAQDKAAQDAAWKKLGANAEEIAKFLSGANPNLPIDTLRGLLIAHGGHHVQQITQLRAKDYAGEAQTWEAMKQHMYVIADALAGAIAKQFPTKFS